MDETTETQSSSIPDESTSQPLDFILAAGSSLHPTFLLAVDGTLACLLFVFIGLAFAANSSTRIHVFALIGIELGLWASIKWFVYELKKTEQEEESKKNE